MPLPLGFNEPARRSIRRTGVLKLVTGAVALAVVIGACAPAPAVAPAATPVAAAATPSPTPTAEPTPEPTPEPTLEPTPTATPTPVPTPVPTPTPPLGSAPTGEVEQAVVWRVVDGDTIDVYVTGVPYRVPYMGVDTPETVAPNQPVEWMGREASAANNALVAGKTIVLEKDVSETDRYGRLLRYVWVRTGAG